MQVPAPRGQDSRDGSDPDAAANGGDESSPLGEKSENDTDEAKFDDRVIIIQEKEPIELAPNSGGDLGLDIGQECLEVGRRKTGRRKAAISNRPCTRGSV